MNKVSIIMATYNRAHFIVETIQSIQKQTFLDWECFIIDDGGTDNTKQIILPILEQDKRFQFLKRTDRYKKGLPGCRNYGLDLAKGDYVIFFDDDDYVHPENLSTCLAVIEQDKVDFCHFQKQAYYEQKPVIEHSIVKVKKALNINHIEQVVTQKIGLASCTVLWKKYCFNKIRFNEDLSYAEEWECYSKLISENYQGIIIDTILYYNRKHPNSNTGEFFSNNPIRREAYVNAVMQVVQNLKEKQLLSKSLKRYFVTLSREFQEFNLLEGLLNKFDLTIFEKIKWQLFYHSYIIRLPIYKLKKRFKK